MCCISICMFIQVLLEGLASYEQLAKTQHIDPRTSLATGRLRVAALAGGPSQRQQKAQSGTYGFELDFVDTFVGKCNGVQARRGGRGRGEPTIIYIKERIRFNNNNNHLTQGPPRFLLTRAFFRWAPHPPIRGGVHHLKSPLFTPYPAIPPYAVRTPHPGFTDGRAHITGWVFIGCLPNTSFSDPYTSCHASRLCTHECYIESWRTPPKPKLT